MWLKVRVLCGRLFLKVFATYVKEQEMLAVKDLLANAGDLRPGFTLGCEDLLEEDMAIHSSILAWRIS